MRQDLQAKAKREWDALPDPTHNNLDAALLDQKVAGVFQGKDYAYVPVVTERGWEAGIAVANEDGYNPIDGFRSFPDQDTARAFCNGMNKHIGLPMDHATGIIVSTMGGYSYRGRGA